MELKHFGPIEALSLDLEPGFIAVTGETGAGKSVLLGALRFLSADRGGRVDKALVSSQAHPAWAQAVLQPNAAMLAFLEEQALPLEPEGLCVARSLSAKGVSKAYINGQPVPMTLLQQLGALWIDFHDPSAPMRCLDPKEQQGLLDTFAGISAAAYQDAYAAFCATRAQYQTLVQTVRLDAEALKRLKKTLQLMTGIDLSDAGVAHLEQQAVGLQQARVRQQVASELYYVLQSQALEACRKQALDLRDAGKDPQVQPLMQRLESLMLEVDDFSQQAYALSRASECLEAPFIEEQLERWFALKHAHGGTAQAVREKKEALERSMALQDSLDGKLLELEYLLRTQEAAARHLAQALYEQRQQAAGRFESAIAKKLAVLGLNQAYLHVHVMLSQALMPTGQDAVSFHFAPNPGHPAQPLEKIASSGESARVYLALISALTLKDGIPVLVFDEIDAHVGGEVARCVGQELALLGQGRQVFCITHLPQVAAQATQHYCVTKTYAQAATHIQVLALPPHSQERKTELARMIGDRHGPSALQHAGVLLESKGLRGACAP